jgi:adenine deaminase
MALPVIPGLEDTDTGLFDVNAFKTVPVEAK